MQISHAWKILLLQHLRSGDTALVCDISLLPRRPFQFQKKSHHQAKSNVRGQECPEPPLHSLEPLSRHGLTCFAIHPAARQKQKQTKFPLEILQHSPDTPFMDSDDNFLHYRRRLPHLQPPGAVLFVTFRTHGSFPRAIEEKLRRDAALLKNNLKNLSRHATELLKEWKRLFQYADNALDTHKLALHLQTTAAATIMANSIRHGEVLGHYLLHRYRIMPNHVHLLIEPMPMGLHAIELNGREFMWPPLYYTETGRALLTRECLPGEIKWRPLSQIMKSIKGSTSRAIRPLVGISEPLWKEESYDHWIRDETEYWNVVRYIDNNPVKAGFCTKPELWPWSSAGK